MSNAECALNIQTYNYRHDTAEITRNNINHEILSLISHLLSNLHILEGCYFEIMIKTLIKYETIIHNNIHIPLKRDINKKTYKNSFLQCLNNAE